MAVEDDLQKLRDAGYDAEVASDGDPPVYVVKRAGDMLPLPETPPEPDVAGAGPFLVYIGPDEVDSYVAQATA